MSAGEPADWAALSAITSAEYNRLLELATHVPEQSAILELGAGFGRSTLALARGHTGTIISIDHHRGDKHAGYFRTLDTYLRLIRPYTNVVPVIGEFERILPLFAPCFELVFIDGAHDYEDVKRDIILSLPLLHPLGVLALHDFARHDGVTRVAHELIAGGWRFENPRVDTLAVLCRAA